MQTQDQSKRLLSPRLGVVPTATVAAGDALSSIHPSELVNGSLCLVLSPDRALYEFREGDTTTEDIPTVVAPLGGGAGRWHLIDPVAGMVLTQTAWYVDPTNGADTNTGLSATAAIKTWGELRRRWGPRPLIMATTNVYLLDDLPATDPMIVHADVGGGEDVWLQILGNKLTADAPLATATLTSAQNINAATNQDAQIGDGATDFSTLEGQRTRYTDGGLNYYSWVSRDLGSNTARVGVPLGFNAAIPASPVADTWAIGQVVSIGPLEMPVVASALFDVQPARSDQSIGLSTPLVVRDIEFLDPTEQTQVNVVGCGQFRDGPRSLFWGCKFAGAVFGSGAAWFTDCYFDGAELSVANQRINGGVGYRFTLQNGSRTSLSGTDVIAEGRGGGTALGIAEFAALYASSGVGAFDFATGLSVEAECAVIANPGLLWGVSAVMGGSIGIISDGRIWYAAAAKPTMTGAAADTVVGGATTAYGSVPVVTAANNAMIVAIP